MVKKGGKSQRKGKKPQQRDDRSTIVFREEGEEYAKVTRSLGNGRLEVQLPDKSFKLANIRGKLRRRKTWINTGDVILVAIREYQEDKCDVLFTYSATQLQILKKRKLLPDTFGVGRSDDRVDGDQNELEIDFCDLSDNEEDIEIQAACNNIQDRLSSKISNIKEETEESSSKSDDNDFEFDNI